MRTTRRITTVLVSFTATTLIAAALSATPVQALPRTSTDTVDPTALTTLTGLSGLGLLPTAGLVGDVPPPAAPTGTTVTPVTPVATPELAAYLATLSVTDRDNFVRTQLPDEVTLKVSQPAPQNAAALLSSSAAEVAGLTLSPLATGCWTQRWSGSAKAAAGNTLYTYYTVGGWCASGSAVTDAWLSGAGGQTSTPGWRYAGVIGSDAGIVSNLGRSYSQEQFILSVGGWDVQSPAPCIRVSGTASGTSSAQYACGIA